MNEAGSPPPAKKSAPDDSSNALWRVPQWFPDLAPETLEALKRYHVELLRFNGKLNLISRNTERDADETHFADSILAIRALPQLAAAAQVVDVGSGNGLPGLIFAILHPGRAIQLVESDVRKCEFLKHMVHLLALKGVQIANVRVETLLPLAAGTVGVSRGFASISKTCIMANKLFPVGGKFYHLKGNSWSSEIAEIPSQLISIWTPELVGEYTLPVSQVRRGLVCTTKKA